MCHPHWHSKKNFKLFSQIGGTSQGLCTYKGEDRKFKSLQSKPSEMKTAASSSSLTLLPSVKSEVVQPYFAPSVSFPIRISGRALTSKIKSPGFSHPFPRIPAYFRNCPALSGLVRDNFCTNPHQMTPIHTKSRISFHPRPTIIPQS
jgi:hypothetical protein